MKEIKFRPYSVAQTGKKYDTKLARETKWIHVDVAPVCLYASWFRRMRQAGWKCEKCGAGKRLHIHHKHYYTVGHERPQDVEVLCNSCHSKLHAEFRKRLTCHLSRERVSVC